MTIKQLVIALAGTFVGIAGLVGCSSNQSSKQFSDLPLTEAALLAPEWRSLQRYEARYPIEEASAGNDGCATIEYVITPDYQITDVQTTHATSRYFAQQARHAITRLSFSNAAPGNLTEPVKTRTRFEFCLQNNDDDCSVSVLQQERHCQGTDALFSIGSRVKRL
ncbi:energy transducer TonB [Alkalimonas amylolytica]|uniref:TonB family C-terminal domain-containing protein n=1 Tax=Alkalimonas amylolytica TaxID=152573 RepID=A0A1H4FUQ5_ALKAM|nr:energy transducer TonB [Alkalimonas amylolytica]SEB01083.1 TonB family C-terminal domain-containing protein [Alkalimonas amylolytica]